MILLVFGRFRVCFWAILAGFVAGVLAGRSECLVAKFGRFGGVSLGLGGCEFCSAVFAVGCVGGVSCFAVCAEPFEG